MIFGNWQVWHKKALKEKWVGKGGRCDFGVNKLNTLANTIKIPQPANFLNLMAFVYPCIASIIVNDDQQDATILAYLFIPN